MKVKKDRNYSNLKNQLEIQSMVLIGVVFLVVFAYIPMYGLRMAFQEYNILKGFDGSSFAGLRFFREFLTDPNLTDVVRNTIGINLLGLIIGFPMPIILALLINELFSEKFKKLVQTVSYLPHFLSWVIFGGLALELLAVDGLINQMLISMGILDTSVNFMAQGKQFYLIYTLISVIKNVGFGSILYVAAIAGVDQEMYEAGEMDGCSRIQKIMYITLPAISGTIAIMLIFQISAILNTGFEQIFILQNPLNIKYSETIDTYVYKIGIGQLRYSYATAVGLIKSVISIVLLVGANKASKKLIGKGLF